MIASHSCGRLLALAQAERLEHIAQVLERESEGALLTVGQRIELDRRIERHRRDAQRWREISGMAKP